MAGDPATAGSTGGGDDTTAAATTAGAPGSEHTHGFRDYYRCLRENSYFRLLWVAETIDNVGGWLSYVATLELVEEFSGGSGLAISAVVLIRFLPSLVLAPICGVVADRVNRVRVLLVAALIDAAVVGFLALVRTSSQVALLYLLLTLQFSAASFYDPARKALVPVVVPPADLHLATTIDSFAWSITGAVGASVGGVVASRLGKPACFLIDAATYLVAAWCAWQLPAALGAPDAAAKQLKKKRSSVREVELAPGGPAIIDGQHGLVGGGSGGDEWLERGSPAFEHLEGTVTHAERRQHHHHHLQEQQQQQQQHGGGAPAELAVLQEHSTAAAGTAPRPGPPTSSGSGRGAALLAAASSAMAEGVRAMLQGWDYVSSPQNRDVAALVMMKCTAALVWGAVDVLNVKFSQTPSMQWGDSSTTLGFIFATVGLGCFIGPVVMNRFVPPQQPALRWGVAASFVLFFAGLLLMLLAPSLLLVLLSTLVRSMGSATLWVFSTLIMQQRVPNELLGRMSAIEMALYTISETASSIFGGAAFDVLHLSLHSLLLILTAAAGAMAAGWSLYAHLANRASGGSSGYLPVRQQDTDDSDSPRPG